MKKVEKKDNVNNSSNKLDKTKKGKIKNKNKSDKSKGKKLNKIKENAFVKKILSNKFISKILTKEVILYVVFGLLTTAINVGSFTILTYCFHIDENLANNIGIVLAVLFAYITNKDLVFHSEAQGFGEKFIEFCKFILGRLFTMFIESIGGSLMFKYLPIPTIVSKCLITVVVIILNFFISKFFAFKSSNNENKEI